MPIISWIISIVTVFLSVGGSYLITRYQIKKQEETREKRKIEDWYRKSAKLAIRTEDDWWETMNRGEASHEIIIHEILNRRRDELRDHAADGQTRDVDEQVIDSLNQAANNLDVATSNSSDYYEIEQKLLPHLDRISSLSQQRLNDDGAANIENGSTNKQSDNEDIEDPEESCTKDPKSET